MNDLDMLNVWHRESLVGMLWRNDIGKMGFRYDPSWVKNGFSISQQMPLSKGEFLPEEGVGHHFFANLLPEAGARAHIIRDLKIVNSDFALIKAIGGECAGALTILPVDVLPEVAAHYKQLTNDELKKLFLQKGNVFNFTALTDRPRLLLAGAQDKSPIYVKDNQYYLPKNASPSSHILKFEISGYRNIPAYEYYLTKLANKIGLPTVDVELKIFEQEHYLLVKRYDRILNSSQQIVRLHQEDFCQALGLSHEKKYQMDGGPSFHDCYELVKQVSKHPLEDAESLLKWQIFNMLAGNSDGHAKNISLIYHGENDVALAPFYDLVCTRAVPSIDSKMAFSVGGEFNPDKIGLSHWVEFANESRIREQYLKKVIKEMAEALLESVSTIKDDIESECGSYPALERVQMVIKKLCKKNLRMF